MGNFMNPYVHWLFVLCFSSVSQLPVATQNVYFFMTIINEFQPPKGFIQVLQMVQRIDEHLNGYIRRYGLNLDLKLVAHRKKQ